ncbi:OmpW family protein [Trinickia terrae]|uniref:OmpW family protein n=1 Tax=Trinickia terrae TaxID=2571161 RepID=A0A4U1IB75_9BURK|nr:OmpW family outer membrane protein [Trinickia terrae]TKC90798.1 OmpW family protein [Trinickia terrae]
MKLKQAITGATALACMTAAHAQTAGTFYLTTGWFHLSPQSSSDPLQITSSGGSPVPASLGIQSGSGASVDNSDTIGGSIGYFVTDHLAAEFEIGVPPKFDLQGSGTYSQYGTLGTVRQWSPAFLLKWNFMSAQAKFRPYVGIGATYVWFTDASITNSTFQANVLHGPTSVSTDRSWAPVFNLGFNYNFTDHWFAGVSVSYIPLSVKANFTTQAQTPVGTLTVNSQTKVRLNPIVTYAKIGYRF